MSAAPAFLVIARQIQSPSTSVAAAMPGMRCVLSACGDASNQPRRGFGVNRRRSTRPRPRPRRPARSLPGLVYHLGLRGGQRWRRQARDRCVRAITRSSAPCHWPPAAPDSSNSDSALYVMCPFTEQGMLARSLASWARPSTLSPIGHSPKPLSCPEPRKNKRLGPKPTTSALLRPATRDGLTAGPGNRTPRHGRRRRASLFGRCASSWPLAAAVPPVYMYGVPNSHQRYRHYVASYCCRQLDTAE